MFAERGIIHNQHRVRAAEQGIGALHQDPPQRLGLPGTIGDEMLQMVKPRARRRRVGRRQVRGDMVRHGRQTLALAPTQEATDIGGQPGLTAGIPEGVDKGGQPGIQRRLPCREGRRVADDGSASGHSFTKGRYIWSANSAPPERKFLSTSTFNMYAISSSHDAPLNHLMKIPAQ